MLRRLLACLADRGPRVRASASRALDFLVESFPHLQWSRVCTAAMFDVLDAVARHAVAVNLVATVPDGGPGLQLPWLSTEAGAALVLDTPPARAPLLAILSGGCAVSCGVGLQMPCAWVAARAVAPPLTEFVVPWLISNVRATPPVYRLSRPCGDGIAMARVCLV